MLLNEKTKEKFGYLATELSKGSKKMVVVICDYCQKELDVVNRNMINGKEFVDKDCCFPCRHKKSEDVNLIKYGTKNQFSRKEIKEKISETCQEKYGVDHFTQAEEFKEKTKETCLEKYGTEHANQAEEVKEKIKTTNLERYGSECSMNGSEIRSEIELVNLVKYGSKNYLSSKEGKKKIAATNLEKYGAENVFASPKIQEKIKQTNLTNLGVEYPMQSETVMDKSKKTCIERYGFDRASKNPDVIESIKKTNLERYGCVNPTQNPKVNKKLLETQIRVGITKTFDGKTIRELALEHKKKYNTFRGNVYKHGLDYALSLEPKENGLEKLFKDMLDKNNISYTRHAVVNKRNTDFVLSNGTVVECNGNYWHSDQVLKATKYHMIKQRDYSEVGKRSFFFREDEIHFKLPIIESIVLNHLGKSYKIYARNCTVDKVKKSEAKEFLNKNHLMGNGSGDSFGLFSNNELVSLIQIRRKKEKIYEVARFCTILNTTIVGGFSRLIKFVERNLDMTELFTFIDLRYGTGEYLPNLGFRENKTHPSFKWVNNMRICGRMTFPGDTGYDYGYAKIWDCGQKKFVKTYSPT